MGRPGIDVPRRLGTAYGVAESRHRLRRLAHLEDRLATACAGWIWTTQAFDDKLRLAVLAYESSLAADALRLRSAELAPSTAEPNGSWTSRISTSSRTRRERAASTRA